MGPQHPSTHGVLRLLLKMDGEIIKEAEPYIGYLHRAIEKICENRTYNQCLPFLDRVEYVTSMSCEEVFCLATERIAGMEIPERAEYLRVIMLEFNRIASHLIFLGTFSLDLGAITPFLYCLREREDIIDLFEMTSGQRLTYNYIRVGGVAADIPPEFVPLARKFVNMFQDKVDDYEAILTENPIFLARTKDVGIFDKDMCINYGVSGPILRATGVDWDLRRDDPYSVYDRFRFEIPTGKVGDTWDRYMVRVREMRQSNEIIRQALDQLPEGGTRAKVKPAAFKPPAGEIYTRIENSRGELGCHIIADGTTKPYRVKLRGGSFTHTQMIPEIAPGVMIADLVAIFASMDVILPEVDR
ncbi:MAG: NADH-quinone oxidoreductase subunit D [candidate division Zixibacteria bacterium]|nr:NADH-quinone oxidoreductase subunit D [candidate division Zixibacteria bacterium]